MSKTWSDTVDQAHRDQERRKGQIDAEAVLATLKRMRGDAMQELVDENRKLKAEIERLSKGQSKE